MAATEPRGDINKIRKAVMAILEENEGSGHFILLYCQPEPEEGQTTVLVATVPKEEVVETLLDTVRMIVGRKVDDHLPDSTLN